MSDQNAPPDELDAPPERGWWSTENAALYVLPMACYLLLSSLEPAAPTPGLDAEPGIFGLTYDDYPLIYTVKIAITIGVLLVCSPAWRQWRFRVSPLAIAVGAVGVVLWIVCCRIDLEGRLIATIGQDNPLSGVLGLLGLGAERPAYNPFDQLGHAPMLCYAFLAVRFAGLALVVPVFEELLLRGWLMRQMVSPDLWRVEFGRVTTQAVIVGTAFPMLYHPEKLASLVWFSLVTWLMVRTKNFWDCVAAHAVTNLLLGLYVVWYGAWELW